MAEDKQRQSSEAGDKGREKCLLLRTWFDGVKDMLEEGDTDNAYALLFAIPNYAFDGVEPNFKGLMLANWRTIKRQMDASMVRYDNSKKNGRKGGSPNFKKGQPNPYYPSGKDNQRDNQDDNQDDNLKEEIRNNEEEIRSKNELEEYYYSSLSSDNAFLESVAAKYPELKTDGVRAMLTQFHNCSMADKSEDNSIAKYQNHFKNWLKRQSPMARERARRDLNARAEGERQAAERKKQYDETAKNAMPHDAAMNDPRYKEAMAKLVAESR